MGWNNGLEFGKKKCVDLTVLAQSVSEGVEASETFPGLGLGLGPGPGRDPDRDPALAS